MAASVVAYGCANIFWNLVDIAAQIAFLGAWLIIAPLPVALAYFLYEGVRRLIAPPEVSGPLVLVTALAGVAVNAGAAYLLNRADRRSLNVEGAFQHILNDMYAFIATAVAGLVVWLTGFARADAIAALVVAALMAKAGWGLLRDSGRVLLQAAPSHLDPDVIGAVLAAQPTVVEVHDLRETRTARKEGRTALIAARRPDHMNPPCAQRQPTTWR